MTSRKCGGRSRTTEDGRMEPWRELFPLEQRSIPRPRHPRLRRCPSQFRCSRAVGMALRTTLLVSVTAHLRRHRNNKADFLLLLSFILAVASDKMQSRVRFEGTIASLHVQRPRKRCACFAKQQPVRNFSQPRTSLFRGLWQYRLRWPGSANSRKSRRMEYPVQQTE